MKSVILLILCYLKFLFQGKANKKTNKLNKILIVQMSKLGDMVCTTPMFRAIKTKYPTSKVCVLGNAINKELLSGNKDVDHYIISECSLLKNIKRLKKEKFDFACTAVPDYVSLVAIYLANIPHICVPKIIGGFCTQNTKSYRILSKLVVKIPHRIRHYATREYLKLLEPINIHSDNTKKNLVFSNEAEKKALNFLKINNVNSDSDLIVGISPTAGNKIKEWPVDRFAKLADYIYDKYKAKIILIASSQEQNIIKELIKNLNPQTRIINSQVNIEELKALISKMSLFISVDTGPIYIAEAFNIPTIDIIGPVDENDQPPRGKFNKIVKAKREKSEMYVMNARKYNYIEAKRQVYDISVQMVIDKFEELMKLIK